jgi:hypothetical protein
LTTAPVPPPAQAHHWMEWREEEEIILKLIITLIATQLIKLYFFMKIYAYTKKIFIN